MITSQIITALQEGELELHGQFLHGSNYTFLGRVTYDGETFQAVYKPRRGEQPLWDFPEGTLAKREVAAFVLSQALGWELVPPTIYRRKGPLGPGSLQYYVEHKPGYHYFNFSPADRQLLRPVVVFDIIANNADRKGSHVIMDPSRHLWLIDQGLCFNVDDKLRTVIWDFAGESLPDDLRTTLVMLADKLAAGGPLYLELLPLLRQGEIRAIARRAAALVENSIFPDPPEDRRPYPWPPI